MAEKAKMEVWGNNLCTMWEQEGLEKKEYIQVLEKLKRTGWLGNYSHQRWPSVSNMVTWKNWSSTLGETRFEWWAYSEHVGFGAVGNLSGRDVLLR